MKRILLTALAILALATAAKASFNSTEVCPYDGETAYFRSAKDTPSGVVCKYSHMHQGSGKQVQHEFWTRCEL